MASWLLRTSPDQALAGDTALYSWARQLTLALPFSTQMYKLVLANLKLGWGQPLGY